MWTASEASKVFFKWRVLLIETLSNMSQNFLCCIFTWQTTKLCAPQSLLQGLCCISYDPGQTSGQPGRSRSGSCNLSRKFMIWGWCGFFWKLWYHSKLIKSHPACSAAGSVRGEKSVFIAPHTQSWKGATHVFMHLLKQQLLPLLWRSPGVLPQHRPFQNHYETCLIS